MLLQSIRFPIRVRWRAVPARDETRRGWGFGACVREGVLQDFRNAVHDTRREALPSMQLGEFGDSPRIRR